MPCDGRYPDPVDCLREMYKLQSGQVAIQCIILVGVAAIFGVVLWKRRTPPPPPVQIALQSVGTDEKKV
jgi:hypothetical protein